MIIAQFAIQSVFSHSSYMRDPCDRAPAPKSPLFLAAPGVANAQSAYFSFSQFLQWSDQPIYVLDKDNDLNIADLARQNAADILKVRLSDSQAHSDPCSKG